MELKHGRTAAYNWDSIKADNCHVRRDKTTALHQCWLGFRPFASRRVVAPSVFAIARERERDRERHSGLQDPSLFVDDMRSKEFGGLAPFREFQARLSVSRRCRISGWQKHELS